MEIDWWTLAIQTVNFLVVVWLLSRFLYRPVRRMIEAREADDRKAAEDAAAKAAEAERLRLVALVHHPLAAETGLPLDQAEVLRVAERHALAATVKVITYSGRDSDTMPPVWVGKNSDHGVVIGASIATSLPDTVEPSDSVVRGPRGPRGAVAPPGPRRRRNTRGRGNPGHSGGGTASVDRRFRAADGPAQRGP